jgi:hypothetical protein
LLQISFTWPYWIVNPVTGIDFGLYEYNITYVVKYHYEPLFKKWIPEALGKYAGIPSYIQKEILDKQYSFQINNDSNLTGDLTIFAKARHNPRKKFLSSVLYPNIIEITVPPSKIHVANVKEKLYKVFISITNPFTYLIIALSIISHAITLVSCIGLLLLQYLENTDPFNLPFFVEIMIYWFSKFSANTVIIFNQRNIKVFRFILLIVISLLSFLSGLLLFVTTTVYLCRQLPNEYKFGLCAYLLLIVGVLQSFKGVCLLLSLIQIKVSLKYPFPQSVH